MRWRRLLSCLAIVATAAAEEGSSCCSDALTRDHDVESCGSDVVEIRPATGKNRPIVETVLLEPGETFVGTDRPKIFEDGEGPARRVRITKTLEVDVHECTNEEYAKFVAATAYETDSEKFGWSFVFHLELDVAARNKVKRAAASVEWWLPVNGSWWREPTGPGSDVFEGVWVRRNTMDEYDRGVALQKVRRPTHAAAQTHGGAVWGGADAGGGPRGVCGGEGRARELHGPERADHGARPAAAPDSDGDLLRQRQRGERRV